MTTDRFVEIAGARIRYRDEGAGPPIVLLHGLGSSIEAWDEAVAALRVRYRVLAFDFPGFGLSDPVETAYTPDGAASFVLAVMDALEVPRAVLIGSSLGGAIVTLAAGRAPDRCKALVLIGPAGFDIGLSAALRAATLPVAGEAFVTAIRLIPWLGVRGSFADGGRIPPRLIEMTRRSFNKGAAGPSALMVLRANADLRGVRPGLVATVRSAAARIQAPTLVVWGARDRVVPPAQADVVARAIPGARVHLLPGTGHMAFVEDHAAFTSILREFLASADRAARVEAS